MKKALLVEDDKLLSTLIKKMLSKNGYDADIFTDSKGVIEYIERNQDDIKFIILDVMLPTMNGVELCNAIRDLTKRIPIIMLSKDGETSTKVKALNTGADDYITKPFEEAELIARVNAILKRVNPTSNSVIKLGPVSLDDEKVTVKVDDSPIDLTSIEFKLLRLLMNNGQKVTRRDDILSEIWDVKGYEIMSNSIDVHINKLRSKLAEKGVNDYIKTQRGFGYKIEY